GPLVRIATDDARLELLRHLSSLGHRRLLLLQPPLRAERASRQFRRLVAQHSLPLRADVRSLGTGGAPGGSPVGAAVELVLGGDAATALVVSGAVVSGLLGGLGHAVLREREDVSVVGTGWPSWAELNDPPVSVTEVDYYRCGLEAAELVL